MPRVKECPLCGETMQLQERDTIVYVPGDPGGRPQKVREWVCPECDYFEEAEKEDL
jgi:transposase